MNTVVGYYDIYDDRIPGDEGFGWDEVWVLCDDCLANVRKPHENLGESDGYCQSCAFGYGKK